MKHAKLACGIWIASLLIASVRAQAPATGTLPKTIPIFPLPNAVLFPEASLPLHIFEPRYRAMVADALEGDRIIGMVLLQPGYETQYEGRPPINPIGCAGVITQAERLPDGRFNIMLRGLVKFRVTGEDQSRTYRLAHVDAMPELPDDDERMALLKQRPRLEAVLARTADRLGAEVKIPPDISDEALINALAQYLDLEPDERQALLERQGILARSEALIDLLEMKLAAPR
jgi:Lon protease-like protein